MKNPAREKFLPLLSPYVDGELTPQERLLVEQHLQNNKESAAQVADFRAADGLMRHALELPADDVDWKKFADDVMARVSPEKLPLFERIKLTLSEMMTYQRGPLVAGFAGAALSIAITVPLLFKLSAGTPDGYANSKVEVQTVSVEESSGIRPVVMETEGGDAIIWTIDSASPQADQDGGGTTSSGGKKKKKGGEEGEEEVTTTPKQEGPL